MKKLVLLLLLLTGPAHADWQDWDVERKQLFVAYNMISTIDVLQTRSALKDPCECYEEANPLLGKRPSTELMVGLNLLGSYAMYKLLDNKQNDTLWPMIITGIRLAVIGNNHRIGVRIKF